MNRRIVVSKEPSQSFPVTGPNIALAGGGKGGTKGSPLGYEVGYGAGYEVGGVEGGAVTGSRSVRVPWSFREQPASETLPAVWLALKVKVEPVTVPSTRPPAVVHPSRPTISLVPMMRSPS